MGAYKAGDVVWFSNAGRLQTYMCTPSDYRHKLQHWMPIIQGEVATKPLPWRLLVTYEAAPCVYRTLDNVGNAMWMDESWLDPSGAFNTPPGTKVVLQPQPTAGPVQPTACPVVGFHASAPFQWINIGVDEAPLRKKDSANSAVFAGFCNPCSGFRVHRMGCPLTKKGSPS